MKIMNRNHGMAAYLCITEGLSVDWWSLLKNEWVDAGLFRAE